MALLESSKFLLLIPQLNLTIKLLTTLINTQVGPAPRPSTRHRNPHAGGSIDRNSCSRRPIPTTCFLTNLDNEGLPNIKCIMCPGDVMDYKQIIKNNIKHESVVSRVKACWAANYQTFLKAFNNLVFRYNFNPYPPLCNACIPVAFLQRKGNIRHFPILKRCTLWQGNCLKCHPLLVSSHFYQGALRRTLLAEEFISTGLGKHPQRISSVAVYRE